MLQCSRCSWIITYFCGKVQDCRDMLFSGELFFHIIINFFRFKPLFMDFIELIFNRDVGVITSWAVPKHDGVHTFGAPGRPEIVRAFYCTGRYKAMPACSSGIQKQIM